MNDIAARLAEQRKRIVDAAKRSGRDPEGVRLIAVSKRHSPKSIVEAYEAGQRDFGENYVQELVQKAEELRHLAGLRWHFIGHLQSNKARFVTGLVERVHTISSAKLAIELGKRMGQRHRTIAGSPGGARSLAEKGRVLPPASALPLGVLVEVNVGGEDNKSGCHPRDVGEVLRAIDEQPYLVARGLMTIPPATEDPEGARPYFEQLMALRELNGGAGRLPEMSFGMSADVEVAVESGATFVRVGTAIFGERPD